MQERHYKTILYFISAVILATLAVQVYWNYKNYEAGKAQLVRDVQTSVDNAITTYYENIASRNTLSFLSSKESLNSLITSEKLKNFTSRLDNGLIKIKNIKLTDVEAHAEMMTIEDATSNEADSILRQYTIQVDTTYVHNFERPSKNSNGTTSYKIFGDNRKEVDSISDRIKRNIGLDNLHNDSIERIIPERLRALSNLTTNVIFSINNDTMEVPVLDSLINLELTRKDLKGTAYELRYASKQKDSLALSENYDLRVTATSTLLPTTSTLIVGFSNVASIVLKRNLLGIFLSILLVGAVIASLLYLLKIIQDQKQLAIIKNDFISNITHEFKTPIATIGVAMESILFFNEANDILKTKKYVDISSQQVSKLNTMVEKLLETATLDSDALHLNTQETNIAQLLEHITHSHQETLKGKSLSLDTQSKDVLATIDVFHLENALDNLIDNAIKYGGDHIKINLTNGDTGCHITISDGGSTLTKAQTQHIFEKFYRVPTGNTHNIKGFGIGLYYTKTIIEKHGGTITVQTQPTTFKITLPYV